MPKKLIIISMILISIVLSGCKTPEQPDPITYSGFFVGVGNYMYLDDMDLSSPAPNTGRLKSLFSQCKFGKRETKFSIIERLVDHNATKENILNGILETFAGADDDDVSYFYYMGHGGVRNGTPIITPTDYTGIFDTTITVHELEKHLSMIPGTKVVFLESCHSGNFIDKCDNNFNDMVINIFARKSRDLINKESYQVLTCGKGSEYCWTGYDWSYFCKNLIKGCENLIADKNEDEIVDISELYQYIKLNVTKQTVQIYPEGSTFPVVEY